MISNFIYEFKDREEVIRLLTQHGAERGGMHELLNFCFEIKWQICQMKAFNNQPTIIFSCSTL